MVLAALLVLAFGAPRLFGLTPYVVTSGSMEPEYPVGSLLYVADTLPEQVQAGQAITFYMPGSDSVATHQVRALDAESRCFYTQGVNNRDQAGNILPDAQPVPYENLIGTPVFCVPMLGWVNRLCTTPPGMYFVLGGLAVVIAVSFALDRLTPPRTR